MRVGDVVELDGVEWTVIRTNGEGKPAALRTTGRQTRIHPGSVVSALNMIVSSRVYLAEGFTHIEVMQRGYPVSVNCRLQS